MRIVARYNQSTVIVDHSGRIETIEEAINSQAIAFMEQAQMGATSALSDGFKVDFDKIKLHAIKPSGQITDYSFYPAPEGTFLGQGYFHMVANLAIANNVTTNQLLDAGVINNLGGGFLAKGFRKKMGQMRMKPAEWKSTEISAQDLRNGIMPLPTKDPSPTLFNLNEKLEAQMRNFTLVAGNEQTAIQANTAPTTAMAMVAEQALPTSALLLRITESEGREFKKLFMLNKLYADPEHYQEILDDPQADYASDFNEKGMDIQPTANPEMSNKMQRVQLAEAEMAMFDRVLQAGGNPLPLVKNYFDVIGSDMVDAAFPEEGSMTEQEKQQIAAMTQAQEQANQLNQLQVQLLRQQVENEALEAKSLAVKRHAEMQQILAKVDETMANTALLGERAETESTKNQITTYTAQMQAIRDTVVDSIQPQEQPQQQIDTQSALSTLQ